MDEAEALRWTLPALPVLPALRWWALLQVQVIWSRGVGPGWTAAAAGLAVLLALGDPARAIAPGAGGDFGDGIGWGVAALAELGLGGLVGLVVALPGQALVGSARTSARWLTTGPRPFEALTLGVTAAAALALDLHRPLLVAGGMLFEVWPSGQPGAWLDATETIPVARLAHGVTLLALTLATPVLLAGAVAELTTRLLATGPGVTAAAFRSLAPWLRVAAALVATGASWSTYDAVWAERALLESWRLVGSG